MSSSCLFSLLLWVLLLNTFFRSESAATDYPNFTTKNLTCDQKVRVLFSSYVWTRERDGEKVSQDVIEEQFFIGLLATMVDTAQGNGINCTFEISSYVISCCEPRNMTPALNQEGSQNITGIVQFQVDGIDLLDVLLLLVNILILLAVLSWVLILTKNYPENQTSPAQPSASPSDTPVTPSETPASCSETSVIRSETPATPSDPVASSTETLAMVHIPKILISPPVTLEPTEQSKRIETAV